MSAEKAAEPATAQLARPSDAAFAALCRTADALEAAGVWYALLFGTLLGAVRDGDLVEWDDTFDLLVRPRDVPTILALSTAKLSFEPVERPARHLALDGTGAATFRTGAISALEGGKRVGDLFAFHAFRDGVLRRYDFEREVYWCPHSSFPAFFVEKLGEARVRGRRFPVLQHAEAWLEAIYGADWKTPIRSQHKGGPRAGGKNVFGHRTSPRLRGLLQFAKARGFDVRRYALEPRWPREVRGAGPIGPTPRTQKTSRSLWWRDLDELIAHF